MNTNEFLNLLEVQCDGMNRDGPNGLLFFTDVAQSILRNSPAEQNILFDNTTGRLPVLNTTDSDYDYTAPEGTWRVAGVLVEAVTSGSLMDDFFYYYMDYGFPRRQRSGARELEHVFIGGIDYLRVPYIRSYDAGDITDPTIIFTENPGDTEDVYYWWCYNKAAKLVSDSIDLSIGAPFDYLYLFPATVRLVQGFKDGDFVKAHEDVLVIRKNYMKELNLGEQGFDYNSQDRGC